MDIHNIYLSDKEFETLSNYIYKEVGIKLPIQKKILLESRLRKRLKELKIANFKEYIDHTLNSKGEKEEIVQMFDAVTTNKTDFFREPQHFDFLVNTVLPNFVQENNGSRIFKIWSSAASSGEEPYTIAMVMANWCEKNTGYDYSILGTDISTKVLSAAMAATYKLDRVDPVSMEFKKKYLLKHKDSTQKLVKIIPELRNKCRFERLNLMDNVYNVDNGFDVIFCRNVLIYFDRQTQESVINKLCLKLKTGGHFFLGHSESILQMDVPLKQIKPTIFIKV